MFCLALRIPRRSPLARRHNQSLPEKRDRKAAANRGARGPDRRWAWADLESAAHRGLGWLPCFGVQDATGNTVHPTRIVLE